MVSIIYLSYGVLAFILLGSFLADSFQGQSLLTFSALILFTLLFFTTEWKEYTDFKQHYKDFSLKIKSFDLKSILFLLMGTFISFYINHSLGMGSVIGASAVGLIGSVFFKKYSSSIYCGAFVGMACSIIFANPLSLLTAALISGIMLVLSQNILNGFGGKLGFIAFGGCYVASILFQTPFRVIPALSSELYPLVFIYIIGSGLATFSLQKEWKLDAVTASSLVGLSLALIHPDPSQTVVVAAYCASFVGMTSPKKIGSYTEMLFLTLLTSILFIAAFSLFDGSGGRLGSIAFLSVVSGSGFLHYTKRIRQYVSSRRTNKPASNQS